MVPETFKADINTDIASELAEINAESSVATTFDLANSDLTTLSRDDLDALADTEEGAAWIAEQMCLDIKDVSDEEIEECRRTRCWETWVCGEDQ